MGWIELFTPPEWPTWGWIERGAYLFSLSCFLGLMGFGALSLYDKL